MSQSPVIGVDIGGTKIAAGLIDRDGRVLRRALSTTPAQDRDAILDTAVRLACEVSTAQQVAGIGIGSGGVIVDGRVTAATALLSGWAGTDLAGHVADTFGVPVTAINDVHAHGVGEAWCGAGAGRDTVLLVAVGTGLGGVVVHNGEPLTGAHGIAGHVGHIAAPAAAGLACSCGADGHLEAIASGYGILQLYRSLGGEPTVTDAAELITRSSDHRADQAVRRSAAALGAALGDLITIIDPNLVIMSGGVTGAGQLWWDEVRAAAESTTLVASTPIVPAQLGADAGIIGAARFLINSLAR